MISSDSEFYSVSSIYFNLTFSILFHSVSSSGSSLKISTLAISGSNPPGYTGDFCPSSELKKRGIYFFFLFLLFGRDFKSGLGFGFLGIFYLCISSINSFFFKSFLRLISI